MVAHPHRTRRSGALAKLLACAMLLTCLTPAPALAGSRAGAEQPTPPATDAFLPWDAPVQASLLRAQATGDYRIDALDQGVRWPTPPSGPIVITYSFYEDSVWHGQYTGAETGAREVSEGVKANVRAILAWYSTFMNVNFVEVTESASSIGQLRYLCSNRETSPGSYAYAYYPYGATNMWSVSADVHLDPGYDGSTSTNGFQQPPGQHGYMTLVHETGHALGLRHSFGHDDALPDAEDNTAHTVMSYTNVGYSAGRPVSAATPMTYDVLALQSMYGARAGHATADTYAFTARGPNQYTRDGMTELSATGALRQTIWDSGGANGIDASLLPAVTGGYRFDLRSGGWLSATAAYHVEALGTYFDSGTSLALGVTIHTLVNSGSNDLIYANPAANVFGGYSPTRTTGADTVWEASASDVIDLSAFDVSEVATAVVGQDLVVALGAAGSITLKEWTLGHKPVLTFAPVEPNVAPVARASVSQTSGPAPLALTFSGATSTDPDGTVIGWAWTFGDGTSAVGSSVQKTYSTPGTYTARLTVTDDDGATSETSLTVEVLPAPEIARVSDITVLQVRYTRGSGARATVHVTDALGEPVAGVTVVGRWSRLVPGGVSGVTDATGRVTFTSMKTSKVGTIAFTVTRLAPPAGATYDAARNLETGDSAHIVR